MLAPAYPAAAPAQARSQSKLAHPGKASAASKIIAFLMPQNIARGAIRFQRRNYVRFQ